MAVSDLPQQITWILMIKPVQSLSNREVSTPFYHTLPGYCGFVGVMTSVRVTFFMKTLNTKYQSDPTRHAEVFAYLPELEISQAYSKWMPNNCAVVERTGDGRSVGPCGFYLKNKIDCPRHGTVRRPSQG